jgi:hypothetical protein
MRSRKTKTHSTVVSYRIAGQMQSENDCFTGVVSARNANAAKRMTPADMKAVLANEHKVPIEAIELQGVWGEREKRESAAASGEEKTLTMYCYQIKGRMESDEHCYPAFMEFPSSLSPTEEEIRKAIAADCQEPLEKIELVGGARARKFQRRYGETGEDLLLAAQKAERRGAATIEDVLAPLT